MDHLRGKIKVGMIDDEDLLCQVVKAKLESTGEFEVVTTTKPEESEAFISREDPKVLLLDIVMPHRNGLEVVAALKKKGETKYLPIILVSGKGEMIYNKKKDGFQYMPNNPAILNRPELSNARSAEALAEAYGVNDYVTKPYSDDVLIGVIKDVLIKARKKRPKKEEKAPGES